jgi:Family of unknown function (DUF6165)
MTIMVEIAPGELIDKITILEIKLENIRDETKLVNVRREYELLTDVLQKNLVQTDEFSRLRSTLKNVNAELWRIEDDIRDQERAKTFGAEFVALARSVYRTNDRRAALKREINELLRSAIIEEKSYADY